MNEHPFGPPYIKNKNPLENWKGRENGIEDEEESFTFLLHHQ